MPLQVTHIKNVDDDDNEGEEENYGMKHQPMPASAKQFQD